MSGYIKCLLIFNLCQITYMNRYKIGPISFNTFKNDLSEYFMI